MADLWYYAHDGNKSGPLSGQQLKGLADAEVLLPTDTVWKEGTERGVPARKVKHLFTGRAATASPASAHIAVDVPPLAGLLAGTALPEDLLPAVLSAASSFPTVAETIADESAAKRAVDELAPSIVAVASPPAADKQTPAASMTPLGLPRPMPVRRARAIAGKGALIVGQDGTNVRFRKLCTTCGHQDSCWNTMRIITGMTRVTFFCPKCRRSRSSEIQGSIN
jgi:hypothetical protein